uniref:Uncharacterized protein n=1 Tax=uncultured Armatimonadetes bacterium TaxID=157466 RepID=A0A6J4HAR9_9BACT|nr:hypothetical protein AVDCRST_MAG63-285 [uncultured Armatimonadetes bacterium]
MSQAPLYTETLQRFENQAIVTVAAGATCAYLGDERSLREFLVADETARHLRAAGHTVFSLLIDDSLDPLNARQLRVAVNKDEKLQEQFQGWCGKPIGRLPDPWGCHASYAAHFEAKLLDRLHDFGCHPTLISTADLYRRGVYAPYVREVLERHDEVTGFLAQRFPGYTPDRLFWVICPCCGYMDATRMERVACWGVQAYCGRCEKSHGIAFGDLEGKLNWKLDCALRWTLFKIDAEPFSKAYLEPKAGTFAVARALSERFFGGAYVQPLPYGLVKMERHLSGRVLESLPAPALRNLFTEHPATDLHLTADLVMTTASRHEVSAGTSYLDAVKQLLPVWLLTPDALTKGQRDLVAHGTAFSRHFLDSEPALRLPAREHIAGEVPVVLEGLRCLLRQIITLRQTTGSCWESYQAPAKRLLDDVAPHKKAVLHCFRSITGQQQGLPVTRALFLLPLTYLQLVEHLLDLHLSVAVHNTVHPKSSYEPETLPLPLAA